MIGGTTVRKQSRRNEEGTPKEERESRSGLGAGRSLALALAFPSTEEVHFAHPQQLNAESTLRETSLL